MQTSPITITSDELVLALRRRTAEVTAAYEQMDGMVSDYEALVERLESAIAEALHELDFSECWRDYHVQRARDILREA